MLLGSKPRILHTLYSSPWQLCELGITLQETTLKAVGILLQISHSLADLFSALKAPQAYYVHETYLNKESFVGKYIAMESKILDPTVIT